MQSITRFATKSFALLVAGATVAAAPAAAQVTISGTTLGCFGVGCIPTSSTSTFQIGTPSVGESLAFAGVPFSGTTNPVTNGFTVGSFGTLVLTPAPSGTTPNTSFSTPFTLLFQLMTPGGASSAMSSFVINGFVGSANGQGSRDISYSAVGPVGFTFNGGSGTIQIDGGQIGTSPTTISGRVTARASTVPEPSTYALLATGLVGLAGAVVRRRNNAA